MTSQTPVAGLTICREVRGLIPSDNQPGRRLESILCGRVLQNSKGKSRENDTFEIKKIRIAIQKYKYTVVQ